MSALSGSVNAGTESIPPALVKPRTPTMEAWRRLRANKFAFASLLYIVFIFLVGLSAPILPVASFSQQDLGNARQLPSLQHPFGTDDLGRDQFSRIVWGAQTAVLVAIIPTAISMSIGIAIGTASAYYGGIVDAILMRIAEYVSAFPTLLLAIFLAATAKPLIIEGVRAIGLRPLAATGVVDYLVILIILSLLAWPGLARIVRGQVLSLRERDYILAAQAVGVSEAKVMFGHLLPNISSLMIVVASGAMAGAVGAEAVLSFLGIGIVPPYPSWGSMVAATYGYLRTEYWVLLLAPSFMVASLLYAFTYLGDGLGDILNPQTR